MFVYHKDCSGSEVIKLFSFPTELSMKFQRVINAKMLENKNVSCFQTIRYVFILLIHVIMPIFFNFWHFNIYEHDKFHANLNRARTFFIISGSDVFITLLME